MSDEVNRGGAEGPSLNLISNKFNTVLPPTIAPQSIRQFSPDEYREYVRSLRGAFLSEAENKKEKKRQAASLNKKKPASPVKDIHFRFNLKGTPIITIRNRSPKWISRTEITKLAKFHGLPLNEMWLIVKSKNILISKPSIQEITQELS